MAVGCAQSFVMVPDAEWQTVPSVERAQIDRNHAADVARADAERTAALIALERIRAETPPRVVPAPTTSAASAGAETDVTAAYERSKRDAIGKVATATAEWRHARITFYERRVELAAANVAVLHCSHEVARARAVDHHRLGFDTYDGAPFRGQLSLTQERWYQAETRMNEAREALTRATANLADEKDVYAAIVRGVPREKRAMELADFRDCPLRERTTWRERTSATSAGFLVLGGRIARK